MVSKNPIWPDKPEEIPGLVQKRAALSPSELAAWNDFEDRKEATGVLLQTVENRLTELVRLKREWWDGVRKAHPGVPSGGFGERIAISKATSEVVWYERAPEKTESAAVLSTSELVGHDDASSARKKREKAGVKVNPTVELAADKLKKRAKKA